MAAACISWEYIQWTETDGLIDSLSLSFLVCLCALGSKTMHPNLCFGAIKIFHVGFKM